MTVSRGRFLIVVSPFAGHLYPASAIATELEHRGHMVAWVSHQSAGSLLSENSRLYGFTSPALEQSAETLINRTSRPWVLGLKVMWDEVLLPLARVMAPVVEQAMHDFKPDVVLVDEEALAGSLLAQKHGLAWATSSTSGRLQSKALDQLPRVKDWMASRIDSLAGEFGLDQFAAVDVSPHLVLLFTTTALAGDRPYPGHYKFVGPLLAARSEPAKFPWGRLGTGTKVYASTGTLYRRQGAKFLCKLVEALRDEPLQVVVVGDLEACEAHAGNVIVVKWAPQLELMARMDAVVSHGGRGTVTEALAFGLPLVVAPIAQDQGILADQVVAAGAGIRLRHDRVTVCAVRDAVQKVLNEPQYRAAAQRIAASFQSAGGVTAAADTLEQMRPQVD
jgi:MGT family glycosyltransferase